MALAAGEVRSGGFARDVDGRVVVSISGAGGGGGTDTTSATAGTDVFNSNVTSDAQDRFIINADGKHEWGGGALTQDLNLYRSAAGVLKTDQAFTAVGTITCQDNVVTSQLYTAGGGANQVYMGVNGSIQFESVSNGWIQLREQTSDPAAPSTNYAKLYVKDNGSAKTQLAVRFPTGAVAILATEP